MVMMEIFRKFDQHNLYSVNKEEALTSRVYIIDPIDTNEIYLRADIDLRRDSGKIKQMVVRTDCRTLNSVIPPLRPPVIESGTPKFLQQITNNLVTI